MGLFDKIRQGFNWLGKKIGEGWNHVRSFGKKAWETIRNVPVIGTIAEGIRRYTPIGQAADRIITGVDAGVGDTSKLLQGDVRGAVQEGGQGLLNVARRTGLGKAVNLAANVAGLT
jgi:hypothetical protein